MFTFLKKSTKWLSFLESEFQKQKDSTKGQSQLIFRNRTDNTIKIKKEMDRHDKPKSTTSKESKER